jgi:hypothetical protein
VGFLVCFRRQLFFRLHTHAVRPFVQVGFAVLLVQHRAFGYVDTVTHCILFCDLDEIANFALEADIADQAMTGFRVHSRHISSVGVAVGIPVHYVEEQDELMAAGQGGGITHRSAPGRVEHPHRTAGSASRADDSNQRQSVPGPQDEVYAGVPVAA